MFDIIAESATTITKYIFVLAVYMLFKKQVSKKTLLMLIPAAFILDVIDPIGITIENIDQTMNPQYSNIIMSTILISGLIIQLLFKKHRSVDRILVSICLGAAMTTTVVFHYFIVHKSLMAIGDVINAEAQELAIINPGKIVPVCKSRGFECYVTDDVNSLSLSPSMLFGLSRIQADTSEMAMDDRIIYSYYFFSDIDAEGESNAEYAFITYMAEKKLRVVVIAKEQARVAQSAARSWFYFTSAIAHLSWLLMIILLIFKHRQFKSTGLSA